VWASGAVAWTRDLAADPRVPRAPAAARCGLHAAVGGPIVARGTVLGALELFSARIREPDPELLPTLTALGAQIGTFVEAGNAARALRESHARVRAILDSALDAIVTIDHEGRILELNPAAERIFGLARADAVGKEAAELLVPPDRREAHRQGLRRAVATGEGPILGRRVGTVALRADGSEFPVELGVVRVDSTPPTFVGVVRDMTEARRAADELRRSRDRLEFLAQASTLLTSSLDERTVVERLAAMVVPTLGDWCLVDVVSAPGLLRPAAVVHADPALRERAERLVASARASLRRRAVAAGEPRRTSRVAEALGCPPGPATDAALAELGGASALVVPLVGRGRAVGALTLVTGPGRTISDDDVSLMQELARRAALAVDNALLYRERVRIARTLQRSLLVPSLPAIPGVELATRYYAAGEGIEVGGDFYDVFQTGRDDWALIVGDVCGTGVEAASVTALARYTARAAAMQARRPSRVLGAVNEALLAQVRAAEELDVRFCTVAYARLRPVGGGVRVTAACAGHPAPVAVTRSGRIGPVCATGTLLGVVETIDLADRSVRLAPGELLVLYTDGLVEARGAEGPFGEERLHALLGQCAGLPAAEVAERVERAVLEFITGPPRDDVALLVLRVRPEP
jgi:PAS domain S-box-containing protein